MLPSSTNPIPKQARAAPREGWLRKHADYQRVYREGKRQSLPLMTYFFALRADGSATGSRVGLTAGRVLGNAVARNRIKRRMRAAVGRHRTELTAGVDVILHPRKTVLEAEFSIIERDVLRAFRAVQTAAADFGMR
jgi:ribonuclease P protein component